MVPPWDVIFAFQIFLSAVLAAALVGKVVFLTLTLPSSRRVVRMNAVGLWWLAIPAEIACISLVWLAPQLGSLAVALLSISFNWYLGKLLQSGTSSCRCFGIPMKVSPAKLLANSILTICSCVLFQLTFPNHVVGVAASSVVAILMVIVLQNASSTASHEFESIDSPSRTPVATGTRITSLPESYVGTFLFVAPGCAPCGQLLESLTSPDISQLQLCVDSRVVGSERLSYMRSLENDRGLRLADESISRSLQAELGIAAFPTRLAVSDGRVASAEQGFRADSGSKLP